MSGYIVNGGGTKFKEPKVIVNHRRRKVKKVLAALQGWRLVFKHEKQVADSGTILPGCSSPEIRMHCRYVKDSL